MCMYPANAVPSCAAGAHWAHCPHACTLATTCTGLDRGPTGSRIISPLLPHVFVLPSLICPRANVVLCVRSLGIGYVRVGASRVARGCGVNHFHIRVTLAVHIWIVHTNFVQHLHTRAMRMTLRAPACKFSIVHRFCRPGA